MVSASSNGLIYSTNCLLTLEDGSLVEKDLWVDETHGLVLDAQVRYIIFPCRIILNFLGSNRKHFTSADKGLIESLTWEATFSGKSYLQFIARVNLSILILFHSPIPTHFLLVPVSWMFNLMELTILTSRYMKTMKNVIDKDYKWLLRGLWRQA